MEIAQGAAMSLHPNAPVYLLDMNHTLRLALEEGRPVVECEACEGSGVAFVPTDQTKTVYGERPCSCCDGAGVVPE